MAFRRLILAALVGLLSAAPIAAENARFQKLSLGEGLSQSTVQAIAQDRRGYLWIGTLDGLNRWDGQRFHIFRASDTPGLCDSNVGTLHEDSEGRLWIGTLNGLSLYDPTRGDFRCFAHPPGRIVDLEEFDGRPHLAINGVGVMSFDLETERFSPLGGEPVLQAASFAVTGGSISSKAASSEAASSEAAPKLWIGTLDAGLYSLESDGLIRPHSPTPSSAPSYLKGQIPVLTIDPGDQNVLWIVSVPDGILRYDVRSGSVDQMIPFSALSQTINDLLFDEKGSLWIATLQGLAVFDPQSNDLHLLQHDPLRPESLSFDGVLRIYAAPERPGLIWVGTAGGGVNLYDRSRAVFGQIDRHPAGDVQLSNAQVRALLVDHAEELWVGTLDGLHRINTERNQSEVLRFGIDTDVVTIWSLLEDRAGELWAGSPFGLFRIDRRRETVTSYTHKADDPTTLSFNNVRGLLESEDGSIWAATTGGLNRFDRATETFTYYLHDPEDPQSLSHNLLRQLAQDRQGRLWIATFGGGLNRLDDAETPHFVRFRHDPGDPTSLNHDRVISVYEDSRDLIWVGTDGGGLDRYDEAGFFHPTSEGLPNRVIYSIIEDLAGDLWISTNAGLSRLTVTPDGTVTAIRSWDQRDGLQDYEFNSNAAFRAASGELYFGGINGLNFFDPRSLHQIDETPPPVILGSFWQQEERVDLERPLAETELIELPYDASDFGFEITALSFRQPEKNRYRYQLKGFDPRPLEVGVERRLVRYTNVPPGEYVFQATASNHDGIWNPDGTSIRVVVVPPWWHRAWARLLFVLLTVGLLAWVQQRHRRRLSEKAESERRGLELEGARRLQMDLLPLGVPEIDGWEIAARMETATEVGGDYYDFRLANGVLTAAVGDATGHGIRSGTLVAVLKGLFCAEAEERSLLSFFRLATETFRAMKIRQLHMALVLLRLDGPRMIAASAGMPPLLIWREEAEEIEEILFEGAPLGAFPGYPYEDLRLELSPGDTILIATDGLSELCDEDGEMLGDDLVELFKEIRQRTSHTEDIVAALFEAARRRRGERPLEDDITCVVLRRC